jgi:hypothetical protein
VSRSECRPSPNLRAGLRVVIGIKEPLSRHVRHSTSWIEIPRMLDFGPIDSGEALKFLFNPFGARAPLLAGSR